MTGKIIYREATETGSYSTQTFAVDERKVGSCIVDSAQIVVHALAGPVATHFLIPFRTKSRQTSAVRGYHYVTVGCHNLEIPAITPELGNRTLWPSLAEKQGGVLLGFIEMGRQDNPYQHLLAIGGFYPALLYLANLQLIEDVLVFIGELGDFRLLLQCNGVNIVRMAHRMAGYQQFLGIAEQLHATVVIPPIGDLAYLSFQIGLIYVDASVPTCKEVKCLAVVAPAEFIDIGVERFGDILFFTRGEVIDQQAVAIAFVTVVLHALPCYIFAVGRELGILVVADIEVTILMIDGLCGHCLCWIDSRFLVIGWFAKIAGGLAVDIVKINV